MGCGTSNFKADKDFRKGSIYQNTELRFDKSSISSKGSILLIHGTAPQNLFGQIALPEAHDKLSKRESEHYIISKTYEQLSQELNKKGWNTLRYTRVGVYQDDTRWDEYGKTDLENIVVQLKKLLEMMPDGMPKVVFCWSGGSVHALQLPLEKIDGLIILGGIATKRTEVAKLRAKNEAELEEINKQLVEIISKEGKVSREEMLGVDMPFGRFFDENRLKDNWTYLRSYPKLPTLILHGDADAESDVSQAFIWEKNLPDHEIKTVIKSNGNHAWGVTGNLPDMVDLAKNIGLWLDKYID